MYRALETLERKPLVRDPYAIRFLPRDLPYLRAARERVLRRLF